MSYNGELVSKEWHNEQMMRAESEIKRLKEQLTNVLVCIKDTDNNIDVERLQNEPSKSLRKS